VTVTVSVELALLAAALECDEPHPAHAAAMHAATQVSRVRRGPTTGEV
jgi:hypothetical protein